jgi:hypothetical protein
LACKSLGTAGWPLDTSIITRTHVHKRQGRLRLLSDVLVFT